MSNTPKNGTLIQDFTTGNITSQLLKFSAPLFLANLLQIVYNMVDMVIVSYVVGKTGLSAVAVGGDVSSFLTFISMGFSSATQIIIAQRVGAGRKDELGRFIGTTFQFLFSCAIAMSVICFVLRRQILNVLNTPVESFEQALGYSTVCIAGLIFIYGYNAVSAVLRGLGDSKHPLLFVAIAAGLNVLLDLVFVVKYNWGATGAALATVISQAVSFICCVVFLWKNRSKLGFNVQLDYFLHIDHAMLKPLINLGIPLALRLAAIQFSRLFVSSWINSYGVAVSAMAGIGSKIFNISSLFSNAVNAAGSSMVGQNIGAGNFDRVPKILRSAFSIVGSIALVLSALVVFFPNQVFGIFTNDPEVMVLAMEYIPIAVLLFFGCACRDTMYALTNGSGHTKINFVCAILDGLILRISLSLFFGLYLGMEYRGFWLGDALSGFTPTVISLIFYFSGKWRKQNPLD